MKFRAPRGNNEVLAEPGLEALPGLVDANRETLNRSKLQVGGLALQELRALARREALDESAQYLRGQSPAITATGLSTPLVLAGHQPELSHPGVWVKHFALHGLARRIGGTSLNLVVDNDTLKSTSIRVPTWDNAPSHVRSQAVAFDSFAGEVPYESRGVRDSMLFATFAERVAILMKPFADEPLLTKAWKAIVANPAATIGEKFASVRRQFERDWGCHNLELPVSRLARTEAFARFASHILEDRRHFRAVYNRSVQTYRDRHGLRSRSHPVPDLAENEVPFWGEMGRDGRRGRVTGSPDPRTLRPRALTLTLFARVCLGDFFLHGIGGGTYDEVTDAIIRGYFHLEPPAFQVLSATLHLPLPTWPATMADVKRQERLVRDLRWNPQRHLAVANLDRSDVQGLCGKKAALIASEPPYPDHEARKEWYRRLCEVNEALRYHVSPQVAPARTSLARSEQETAANAILQRRDYSWVLYPEAMLRDFCQRFLA